MARAHGDLIDDVTHALGDGPCVIALGGGADSAALLGAAHEALGSARIRAVFVQHSLVSGDILEKAAREVCDQLDVRLSVLRAPVSDGPDLEARARHRRYEAIEGSLAEDETVATAHTLDDQAETVLMRMARGSGSTGLGAIRPQRGRWRRPFLRRTKAELREYADTSGLTYADDAANTDPRFTRSRVRHDVMPVIDANLPGSVLEGFARSAELLAADDAHLESFVADIPWGTNDSIAWIAAAPLATADDAIASRVVRRCLRSLMDGLPGQQRDVELVLAIARGAGAATLSRGIPVRSNGPHVLIGSGDGTPASMEVSHNDSFTWCGETYTITRRNDAPTAVPGGRLTVIAADVIDDVLTIRGAEAGDRVDIGIGTTPVMELLRHHGVAAEDRHVSLVVADGAKIVAVVGVRTAAWAESKGGPVVVIEREVGS